MAGAVITPKKFAEQWKTLSSKFDVNVFNFETAIGKEAVRVFKQSFYLHKFNTTGATPWPSRNDKKKHPLLYQFHTLYDSIRVKKNVPKHNVVVFTDDSVFACVSPTDAHRFGAKHNKEREYGFVYAAIHNLGGKGSGATGKAAFIKQRQFIGHSSVLEDKLHECSKIIFDGLPITKKP